MQKYSVSCAREKVSPTKSCSCSSSDENCSHSLPLAQKEKLPDLLVVKSEDSRKKSGEKIPPLVITTKSQSAPIKINDLEELLQDAQKFGFEKYILQNIAKKLIPKNRVCNCLSRLLCNENGATVHRSKKHGKCHYGNLVTCSLLWVCPVCATKISERRRAELQLLLERHRETGGLVLMITYTFPHEYRDALPELLKCLRDAMTRNKQSRAAKKIRKSTGLVGTVRALEVTHGYRNGWHPHIHELWLLDGSVPESEAILALEEELYRLWSAACVRSGLPKPSKRHGLHIQNGEKAEKYVAKWGLESELTKAHIKKGRKGNRTPWDFLRDIFLTDDPQSKVLFREYAKAFKGQRQLVWSRGLKALYEIEDMKDAEIAREYREASDMLGNVPYEDWKLVLKYEVRGQLLKIAELGGWQAVLDLLEDLKNCDNEIA